jgi:hypothetical protein
VIIFVILTYIFYAHCSVFGILRLLSEFNYVLPLYFTLHHKPHIVAFKTILHIIFVIPMTVNDVNLYVSFRGVSGLNS